MAFLRQLSSIYLIETPNTDFQLVFLYHYFSFSGYQEPQQLLVIFDHFLFVSFLNLAGPWRVQIGVLSIGKSFAV